MKSAIVLEDSGDVVTFDIFAWQAQRVDNDLVNLSFPARPRFAHLVRVAGANLGVRLGWSIIDIDQLRDALDGSTAALIGPLPQKGSLEAAFEIHGETLHVELALVGEHEPTPSERVTHFHQTVDAIVDSTKLDPVAARVFFTKTRSG